MAKASFAAAKTLSGAAVKFVILIGINAVNLSSLQAEPRYHCPSGQIYRVSKKICVPKGSAFGPLTAIQKSEESPASSSASIRADGVASADAAPRISTLDELLASIGQPKAEEAETPRIPQPEPVTSKSFGFDGELDAVLQARIARESETPKLEKDVVFYREALGQQTRERAPLKWAAIQNNLGNALAALGERESSNAKLEQAVALYREALTEQTRERAPLEWATIQSNLGLALATLGERESGIAKLSEALAVKREVRNWAMRTGNQGIALMQLAERSGDTEMARMALRQINIAFATIRDGEPEPLFAAYYEEQLPKARALVERLSQR